MTKAIAVELSANAKTGPVSTTYVSQGSCPASCPLRNAGCYAESGMVGIHTAKLNRASAPRDTPESLARAEVKALAKLTGSRPLRLHVVGDAATPKAASILARAVTRWTAPVWSYTHAWRSVARSAWGKVSVLASCESWTEFYEARLQGYAPAFIVPKHPENGKAWQLYGWRVIPCPAQTRAGVTCSTCKLCWKDSFLRETRSAIAFEAHGSRKRMVSEFVQLGGVK
jgi:hypothetical protein